MSSKAESFPDEWLAFLSQVLEKLASSAGYAILVILFIGFVYEGLRPIWQVRFTAVDLWKSRFAFALAPLPLGILIFSLGISRPYLKLGRFETHMSRILAFAFDVVFICTFSASVLMFLVNPFAFIVAPRSRAIVAVYYATDRQPPSSNENDLAFSGEPSAPEMMSYGLAQVPVLWRPRFWDCNSTTLFEWDIYDPVQEQLERYSSADEFARKILTASRDSPRHEGFLFIHGFDNRFDEALAATAKLSYDLMFDSNRTIGGVSLLFSWPSCGMLTCYDSDYEHATESIDHLTPLLRRLTNRDTGLNRLQLIAHSMGTRVLGEAIKKMEQDVEKSNVDNVTLAAADVDQGTFDSFSPALRKTANRITLYVSDWDAALVASSVKHWGYRVGLLPTRHEGMDVVDTHGLEASLANAKHSYVFESQFVLTDLFDLLRHDDSPDRRHSLRLTIDGCCWQFERR